MKKSSAPVHENEQATRYLMIEGNLVSRSFNGLPIKRGSSAPGDLLVFVGVLLVFVGVGCLLPAAFDIFDDPKGWLSALIAAAGDGLYCSQSATRNSVLEIADAFSSFTSSRFLYPLL